MNTEQIKRKISSECSKLIGSRADEEQIKKVVANNMENLKDAKYINGYSVNSCQYEHDEKNWLGRMTDWIKWKTPFKKLFYKPKYVQVSAGELVKEWWERGASDIPAHEINKIQRDLGCLMVWTQVWPQNPYTTVNAYISMSPPIPIGYIYTTVKIGGSDG